VDKKKEKKEREMFSSVPFKEPVLWKNAFLSDINATITYEPPVDTPKAKYDDEPSRRTLDPLVTGTSVIGIKYADGIMMAADTLASYGSLARFRNIERIRIVGKNTLVAGSGEYSDFQYIMVSLEELVDSDNALDDGHHLQPKEIYSYLTRMLYNRRNKFDPLWNQIIVAGVSDKNQIFLGQVDLMGTAFEDNTLATGYGAFIARPLLRHAYRPNLSEAEAKDVLERCMRVLYYRDGRSLNKIQIAKATATTIEISKPYELPTEWRHTEGALGYPRPD